MRVLLFSVLNGHDVCCRESVVTCLSEHVRNDTLLDKPHRIPKACRNQLKIELLQRVSVHFLLQFSLCTITGHKYFVHGNRQIFSVISMTDAVWHYFECE